MDSDEDVEVTGTHGPITANIGQLDEICLSSLIQNIKRILSSVSNRKPISPSETIKSTYENRHVASFLKVVWGGRLIQKS